jgi:hypothetical protein
MPRLVRIVALTALIGAPEVCAEAALEVGQQRPDPSPVVLTASLSAGWIEGVVTDDGQRPIVGAAVTAHGRDLWIVETDSDGRFAVRSVPPGTYLLRVQGRGFTASRREFIQVVPARGTRLDVRLRRSATMSPPPESRVIAAGMGASQVTASAPLSGSSPPDASTAASPEPAPAETEPHDHSSSAWRLRHLKRSVLRESTMALSDPDLVEGEILADKGGFNVGDWAIGLARTASSFATNSGVRGRVQLLTSGAFDQPSEDMLTGDLAAGVAYFNLAAPVSTRTSWVVEGATAQGEVSSWFVSGSYATVVAESHALDVHSSYSRQRYAGGNPQALAAFVDGSRSVGGVHVSDRWTLSPRALVTVGGRYEYFDYLNDSALFSPSVAVAVSPADRTWVRARLIREMTAPGAEEFVPQAYGSLALPPQRTFAPLVNGAAFGPQRMRHLDFAIEQDIGSFEVAFSHFRQDVRDQLATIYGIEAVNGAPGPDLGHYSVTNVGGFRARGWGVSVGRPVASHVRGSIEYRMSSAEWTSVANTEALVRHAPSAVRGADELLHDVVTRLDAEVPQTSTRVLATYRLNSRYSQDRLDVTDPAPEVRFDVQLYQGLPFITGRARWELVFAVRNLVGASTDEVGSIYEDLLVVRPPKRVVGGITVQF